ncbi:MAG: ribosome maturation factor RimM [Thermoleophilia bacterium]
MRQAPEWILVGLVKRIHGRDGELMILPLTQRDGELFAAGAELNLSLKRQDVRVLVKIATSRTTDRGPLIRLEGFSTREEVWELFGASFFIRSSELPQLPAGDYYPFQLEGCEVFAGEQKIGAVTDLREPPRGNPYLEIDPGDEQPLVLVPFVSQVVTGIDLEQERIDILPGFLG